MNVLLLTPDRVGSTLLQRVLTIYMLRREFDRPVINLHELTNGLVKYYNETLNQEVLGKPRGTEWGYFQKLQEVEDLLKSVDHYKTSRLAHYHILNRQDSIADQIKFYEYLNKEFFIISCRRENLFEHALSWGIQATSKRLNVYSPEEKIDVFSTIYQNGVTIPKTSLIGYLTRYKEYIEWSNQYFNIQSYFNYDNEVHNLEKYILNLDFMKGNKNNTWQDMFGQEFNNYNACHKLLPDLLLSENSLIKRDQSLLTTSVFIPDSSSKLKWNSIKGADWPEYENFSQGSVPADISNEIGAAITNYNISLPRPIKTTKEIAEFLNKNLSTYHDTSKQLNDLIDKGFLVTSVPIKLQSLEEKKYIVKNFNECITWYNEWVGEHKFGKIYTDTTDEKLKAIDLTQTLLQ